MNLPNDGFLRLTQIIGNPKSNPPIQAIIPLSKSTWWAGIRDGRFPKPVKLSTRCTAWRVSDIRTLVEGLQPNNPSNKNHKQGGNYGKR